ncbi:MAG TPA: hypothetical protein PLW22_11945, partial [Tenuifilum sp.]|uniref:hypothetical protein n=1 Tax=Tenuifilum sp. TaxID=2760880 RepID=UPI002BB2D357|nr:hypothetical protein [Tenuifilum sp.]HQE55566.1 hypothetical protein [Tenuifilum sp.]HQG73631.1 hypothetical protein [Tenuifilum sp.]HQI89984.1 hypothetical protein [Tenuifilum sp.]HRR12569.1 hypothetical protein [Tenuifilum sp.]
PPQKPTAKNKRHSGVIRLLLSESPKTKPIIKLPKMLTVKVPHGKLLSVCSWKYLLTRKRNALPTKPPMPTIKIDLNMNFFLRRYKTIA